MNKSEVSTPFAHGSVSTELSAAPLETMLSVLAFLERAPFRRESARTREMLIDLLLEHHHYDGALQHIGALVRGKRAALAREEIALACSVCPPAWDPPDPMPEYEELDELDLEPLD
jgi:hypothetical protein